MSDTLKIKLPYGTCDTHHHIYNPKQFPCAPFPQLDWLKWTDEKPSHTTEEYLRLARPLGITHNIIVATTAYGYDHQSDLDALSKFGNANSRAILLLNRNISNEELIALDKKGVRGSRAYLFSDETTADVLNLAPRFAELGWNLDFSIFSPADVYKLMELLPKIPCEIVIDHHGGITGLDDPILAIIKKLLKEKRVWVKISALFRSVNPSEDLNGSIDIAKEIARNAQISRALVETAPERILWASDWPFNWTHFSPDKDLATLVNTIPEQITNENLYEQILAKNPAKLYGFKL